MCGATANAVVSLLTVHAPFVVERPIGMLSEIGSARIVSANRVTLSALILRALIPLVESRLGDPTAPR